MEVVSALSRWTALETRVFYYGFLIHLVNKVKITVLLREDLFGF